jgi:hypothetical protein
MSEEVEQKILQMVQDGVLTSSEAAKLLETLAADREAEELDEPWQEDTAVTTITPEGEVIAAAEMPDMDWFRDFWQIPFFIALTILLLSGWGLWSVSKATAGVVAFFGFLCLTPLFVLAFIAVLLSFWSQYAYWLHVRVREKGGTRIAISLPLPLILIRFALRIAGRYVGENKAANLFTASELLAAMGAQDEPLYIAVDDDDGDQVQIYIG